MIAIQLNKIKAGSIIQRKPDSKTLYIKKHYDKSSKSFSLIDIEDINREIFLKSNAIVYID